MFVLNLFDLCFVRTVMVERLPGGFLVQRSIRGRAAEMGLKISPLA